MSADLLPTNTLLAIDGGEPVSKEMLLFGRPCLGPEELQEVQETLQSGWIGTGPRTRRFEEDFADYVGAEHAIALNSCTAGLFLALKVLGVGPDDEVITSALTFGATVNVIEHLGARPVLADIDPTTLNIDPVAIDAAISPSTKVLLPVHFGGLACDMTSIQDLATAHGLAVVEDAAHAVGTRFGGQTVGSISDLTAFSFYANKNLTTAEGGMLTTDDRSRAEHLRRLRLHGLGSDAWKRFRRHRFVMTEVLEPGYKFNMPDLAAALGIHQLRKQESFLEVRERYAQRYDEAFENLPVRHQPRPTELEADRHGLHLYVLQLDPEAWSEPRNRVVDALLAENIGAAVHYGAIHTQPYYRERYAYEPSDFPHALHASETVLSLPLTPAMSAGDIDTVIRGVHKVASAYVR